MVLWTAVLALALPAVAGNGAMEQLRAAVPAQAETPAAPAAAGVPVARSAGNVRFCAFAGGRAAIAGELPWISLEAPAGAYAGADTPVPVSDQGAVHAETGAKARALLSEMLSQSPAAIGDSLRRKRVFLVIIPQDKKLTDLPAFASLRGVRLPDGRVWDSVRGVGFVSQDDGTVAVAAGEENFVEGAAPDGYPKGFLIAHEFSHAVHGYGVSPDEADSIRRYYRDRESGHLPFPSHYASTDDREYFAVSASNFFGRVLGGKDPEAGLDWIRQNDPPMFSLLGRVYGAPRPLWPEPALPGGVHARAGAR